MEIMTVKGLRELLSHIPDYWNITVQSPDGEVWPVTGTLSGYSNVLVETATPDNFGAVRSLSGELGLALGELSDDDLSDLVRRRQQICHWTSVASQKALINLAVAIMEQERREKR